MERVNTIARRVITGQGKPERGDDRAARNQFKTEMEHFAAAFRHEMLDETIRVYWLALKDIPLEIRTAGLTKCLQRLRFFPTVAEVLTACADVVDERRAIVSARARELQAQCPHCVHSRGWRENEQGKFYRCDCVAAAAALMAQAAKPIERPALPPSTDPEAA